MDSKKEFPERCINTGGNVIDEKPNESQKACSGEEKI